MCSIHLDDATAAILSQNAHHTPAYWWRGDPEWWSPISVWGWLGGHDGQRPMGKFGLDARVTPLLFFEGHPGIVMTTESQDFGLTSHPKILYEVQVRRVCWPIKHSNTMVIEPAFGTFGSVGRCQVLLENEISISIKLVTRRKHEVL